MNLVISLTSRRSPQADSGEANCFEDSADSEGECVLFKGKDGHDTDGSLSLGFGEAYGRVDVPVSVGALFSAEHFCRFEQSVALVTPGSCVVKNDFVKGSGWEHSGSLGQGAHCCGRLAGWHGGCVGTHNGKKVDLGDTHGSYWYWEP